MKEGIESERGWKSAMVKSKTKSEELKTTAKREI